MGPGKSPSCPRASGCATESTRSAATGRAESGSPERGDGPQRATASLLKPSRFQRSGLEVDLGLMTCSSGAFLPLGSIRNLSTAPSTVPLRTTRSIARSRSRRRASGTAIRNVKPIFVHCGFSRFTWVPPAPSAPGAVRRRARPAPAGRGASAGTVSRGCPSARSAGCRTTRAQRPLHRPGSPAGERFAARWRPPAPSRDGLSQLPQPRRPFPSPAAEDRRNNGRSTLLSR